ncbi:hypothetical protein VIGAN_08166900 [Vigna angularis var. angularis]|uniref:Uncharacterized protein n=1 Tax=Vigna angularis var. angularis TaxID=157739 RepID=A0A0S3SQ71_PHAAN|nr:hypothetical protein VIGAN_08166900 [Vigna angularis var. angularis]
MDLSDPHPYISYFPLNHGCLPGKETKRSLSVYYPHPTVLLFSVQLFSLGATTFSGLYLFPVPPILPLLLSYFYHTLEDNEFK